MKITVNGKISTEAIKVVLSTQKEKVKIINEFCKVEKLNNLFYKDAELEYEYCQVTKPRVKKVEIRNGK